MSPLKRRRWLKGLAGGVGVAALVWLVLAYFVPAPPSKIGMATGFKGGAYELFGARYGQILARSHVELALHLSAGSVDNLKLLKNPASGIDVAFVQGGVSNGDASPELISLGRINHQFIWIFYRGAELLSDLPQLKGRRVAIGPSGSGTQVIASKLFGVSGVTDKNTRLLPLAGEEAVAALRDGRADVIFLAFAPNAPVVQALLRDRHVRLMSVQRAEALTRIFPLLTRQVMPQGVIDFEANIPAADVTLLATSNSVLVRKDLHPEIINLLARALVETHGQAGLFQRAGDFPTARDPEYPMADGVGEYYRNGPSLLHRYLPFWLTHYAQRLIALLVTLVAVIAPMFSYGPRLYLWFVRERTRRLYQRLRLVEKELQTKLTAARVAGLQGDLERIDRGATLLRIPLGHSDLFFSLKVHIDLIRTRLNTRLDQLSA
jgi:TRAP transporter TAXI family solute receptor